MMTKLFRLLIESWGYIVAVVLILFGITVILVNVHNISAHKDAQVDALIKQAGESEKNQEIFRTNTDQEIRDLRNTISQQHAGLETLIEQLEKAGLNPITNFDGTIKTEQTAPSQPTSSPTASPSSSTTTPTSPPVTSPPSTTPTTVVQPPPPSPPVTTPPPTPTPPPIVSIPSVCLPMMPCITTNQKGLTYNGSLSQRYF